jgi:hypothetical protein
MAKADWPIPKAFDASGEQVKIIAQAKVKLKKFRWGHSESLQSAVRLGVLLHAVNRDDEVLEIWQSIGQIHFDGTFNLWSAVEKALALQSWLMRRRGEIDQANMCVARIREAGFVEERLNGSLLDRNDTIKESVKDGDTKSELQGRLILAGELAFIGELGGSKVFPIERVERDWAENMDRLRLLIT